MTSATDAGAYTQILAFDELDGFNFLYPGQNLHFQLVGPFDSADIIITVDSFADPDILARATTCGYWRDPMNPLQGVRVSQGFIVFNTMAAFPHGFRTKGMNWDYRTTLALNVDQLRISTRGTDNPRLFDRYDGPAIGHPYIFRNYRSEALPGFKDGLVHIWSNPNTLIPSGELLHVGIELDVWDWSVVSAVASDATGRQSTASALSVHEWSIAFYPGARAIQAEGPHDLRAKPRPEFRARGILLKTSESPVNRVSGLALADVTGMELKLADLNRATLDKLRVQGRLETVEQFGLRELGADADFILVLKGTEQDLPPNVRSNMNFLILDRPQYLDKELFVFAESANDDGVTGAYALLGTKPLGNTPGPFKPQLEIALQPVGAVKASWPDPSAGFLLQQTPSLNSAKWSNVVAEVVFTNGWKSINLPSDGGQMFFRLARPDTFDDGCLALPGEECMD